jgi:flagellar basal-body rod protein FlgB
MIDGMLGSTNLPALERSLQYMAARQKLLAGNIANIETPGYRPTEVAPAAFQQALRDALDQERVDKQGGLAFDESAPVAFSESGTELKPQVLAENIMFHDGNDRSVERLMQKMQENVYSFRVASQLFRNQFDLINTAIRERM